jgi:hypothetical protein
LDGGQGQHAVVAQVQTHQLKETDSSI